MNRRDLLTGAVASAAVLAVPMVASASVGDPFEVWMRLYCHDANGNKRGWWFSHSSDIRLTAKEMVEAAQRGLRGCDKEGWTVERIELSKSAWWRLLNEPGGVSTTMAERWYSDRTLPLWKFCGYPAEVVSC